MTRTRATPHGVALSRLWTLVHHTAPDHMVRRRAGETDPPGERRTSRPVRRILLRPRRSAAAIHLGVPSPARSSGLPAGSGGPPSIACAGLSRIPLGLAPGGVYRAIPVTRDAGGLLPHRFTLTTRPRGPVAVCSLWHCPAGRPGLPLTTTLPCGVRTFLGATVVATRPPSRLVRRDKSSDQAQPAAKTRRR